MNDETTALVRRENTTPLAQIKEMGRIIAEGGLFGMRNENQATTLLLLAQAKGINPMLAMERYHIIENKPSMKSDAMLADFLERGGAIEYVEYSHEAVEIRFKYHGAELPVRWTLEDATRAGLAGKGNWSKYTRQMLKARVVSEGIRAVCPLVNAGMYSPEEVMDMQPERTAPPLLPKCTVTPLEIEAEPVADIEKPSRDEKLDSFMALISGKEQIVLDYLLKIKWLTGEQMFEDLADAHLDGILKKPKPFMSAAEKSAAAAEAAASNG